MKIKSPEKIVEGIDPSSPGKYYKNRYRMNAVGKNRSVITAAIPRKVVDKAAEKAGVSVSDFIKTHQVVALYNNFDGVFYTFEEKDKKEKDASKEPN